MARLEDLPAGERRMIESLDCTGYEDRRPWVPAKPLAQRRVAILSTAALNLRSDAVFQRGEADYRVIPGDADAGDVLMTHTSVNFDRTGFQQDLNTCFPLARLHELAADGVIGSAAAFHYTVSGAAEPVDLEPSARAIAQLLKADAVDTVLLVPV